MTWRFFLPAHQRGCWYRIYPDPQVGFTGVNGDRFVVEAAPKDEFPVVCRLMADYLLEAAKDYERSIEEKRKP